MKTQELKTGYRLAKQEDTKKGLLYFVVRDGHEDVSRNIIDVNDTDFQKQLVNKEVKVYVEIPKPTTTTQA